MEDERKKNKFGDLHSAWQGIVNNKAAVDLLRTLLVSAEDTKILAYIFDLLMEDRRREQKRLHHGFKENGDELMPRYKGNLTYDEAVYYGSPLNIEVSKRCGKKLTICNIDMARLKLGISMRRSNGREFGRLDLFESKHEHEVLKEAQDNVLNILAKAFGIVNIHGGIPYTTGGKFERLPYLLGLFIVKGDPPYDKNVRIRNKVTTEECIHPSQDDFFKFFSCEITWGELMQKTEIRKKKRSHEDSSN